MARQDAHEWDSVVEVLVYQEGNPEPTRLTPVAPDSPCCGGKWLALEGGASQMSAKIRGSESALAELGPLAPPPATSPEVEWWVRGADYTLRWTPAGADHVDLTLEALRGPREDMGFVFCRVDDNGEVTIPADLMTRLGRGMTEFWLTSSRETTTRAEVPGRRLAAELRLIVSERKERIGIRGPAVGSQKQ